MTKTGGVAGATQRLQDDGTIQRTQRAYSGGEAVAEGSGVHSRDEDEGVRADFASACFSYGLNSVLNEQGRRHWLYRHS